MADDRPSDEHYASVVHLRIREARLAKGLRQTDVAGALGIDVRDYQRLERSSKSKRFNPTLFTLRALGKVLDTDPGDLVKEPTAAELTLSGKAYEPRVDRLNAGDEQSEIEEDEGEGALPTRKRAG